jgi:ATP phosphoribosyltransferase
MTESERLKIAVQRKGRLAGPSIEILQAIGLDFDSFDGKLFARCRNIPVDILFIRDDDIPEIVQDGVADSGIVGLNVVTEKLAQVEVLDPLGFGVCRLALAVPEQDASQRAADLAGKRIATSFPRTLQAFLDQRGLQCRIIEISGSVEIAPGLKVAEAICDLVSSGSTLKLNGLRPLETILESQAFLIANTGLAADFGKAAILQRLRVRIQGLLQARRTKYVMMNAPRKSLSRIKAILPGMKSPTVVPLAEAGMIAIHSAVPEEVFWEVIENLKEAGASDILVLPVEKMVPA